MLAKLLHQQCWLWGRDVVRPQGNLLLEHGFQRHRALGSGGSRYELTIKDMRISLWGFGMHVATRNAGVLLARGERHPLVTPAGWTAHGVHTPGDLPTRIKPRDVESVRLVARVVPWTCRWIASFEHWVIEHVGLSHRLWAIRGWERPVVPVEALPEAWSTEAEQSEQYWSSRACPASDLAAMSPVQPSIRIRRAKCVQQLFLSALSAR